MLESKRTMSLSTPLRRLLAATFIAGGAWAATPALAQDAAWPSKPVRLLVGSPPGSPSDTTARTFAEALQHQSGQTVIVENRPGAGNGLAAGTAAKATPDGYTLVLSPDTVVTVNPLIYRNQNYDARTDLVTASILASFSQMLVCNPATGVKSVAELVARSKTERITYSSGGAGVPGHLAAEMFDQVSGAKMEHVPYRGPSPATLAVLSGEVNCGFLATPTVLPHVKSGKLVALTVSSGTPSPLAPDVPSLAAALKQPGLDVSFRLLLQTARGTPAPVIARMEAAAMRIMADPEVKAKLQGYDVVAVGSSTAQAQQTMQAEITRWEPLVKRLGLKVD